MKYHINIPKPQTVEKSAFAERYLKLTNDLADCVSFLADKIATKATIQKAESKVIIIEQKYEECKPFLSFDEACVYLRITPSRLNRIISSGQMTYYRLFSKKRFFKRTELDAWLIKTSRPLNSEQNEMI